MKAVSQRLDTDFTLVVFIAGSGVFIPE